MSYRISKEDRIGQTGQRLVCLAWQDMARHGDEKPSYTRHPDRLPCFLYSNIPVAISLAVAAVLVTAVGRDPLEVVDALWKGAFKGFAQGRRRGQLLGFR